MNPCTMIITSGYNVYPSQLENIIDGHEKVLYSCVVGVKDDYKKQKVKAYVVLRPEYKPTDEIREELMAHCHAERAIILRQRPSNPACRNHSFGDSNPSGSLSGLAPLLVR